jgi:hypothetical protein
MTVAVGLVKRYRKGKIYQSRRTCQFNSLNKPPMWKPAGETVPAHIQADPIRILELTQEEEDAKEAMVVGSALQTLECLLDFFPAETRPTSAAGADVEEEGPSLSPHIVTVEKLADLVESYLAEKVRVLNRACTVAMRAPALVGWVFTAMACERSSPHSCNPLVVANRLRRPWWWRRQNFACGARSRRPNSRAASVKFANTQHSSRST